MLLAAVFLIPALAGAGLVAFTIVKAPRLQVLDLIAEAPASKRHKRAGKVDAVVLHQTGFSRGLDPRRYLKVTAHFVVLADGTVAQLHPVSARLNSSHGFNGRSVAVEFVGNFPSVNGQWWEPSKFGRNHVTEAQIQAGRQLLEELARAGVRFVDAHPRSDLRYPASGLRRRWGGAVRGGEALQPDGGPPTLGRRRGPTRRGPPRRARRARASRARAGRARPRPGPRRREARLMADVNQIHHTYGDLLGSLKRERDEAFSVTQETVRMVPDLFAQASKVIHESIDQHREQVRRSLDHASGDREYQVRAFSQHQETIRHDKTMGFLLNAVQAGVGALGPLAAQILETLRGRPATAGGLLEFQCAQQALAYLHLTLTPLQLKHLFPTSAADFMAVLDAASRCDDESEALRGLRGMEVIFKAPAWGQAAQPDQALAGRYVLGRIAMLRIYKTAAESAGKVV